MPSPQVDSYARFSTPQQKLGDSERRQIEAAQAYCAENGLTLNISMLDEGMSGYHGTHRSKGALGRYIERVEAGKIARGSILIIEDLDRLSREVTSEAQELFLSLINRGIEIVDLGNRRRFSKKSVNANPGELFLTLGQMMGNHHESAKKADRIREGWKKRRTGIANNVPSWIRKTPQGFEIDQTKANVVRRIFAEVVHVSVTNIARHLNQESIPALTNRVRPRGQASWDHTSIARLIRNRTALGEQRVGYYHERRQVVTDQVIVNCYPAIITEGQWYQANAALDSRTKVGASSKRNVRKMTNMFGSLATCQSCGSRMIVNQSGSKGSAFKYIGCSGGRRGLCDATKFHRLGRIEAELVHIFNVLAVDDTPRHDPTEALRAELIDTEAQAVRMQDRLDTLMSRFADEPADSPMLKSVMKLADDIRAKQADAKGIRGRIAAGQTSIPTHDQLEATQALWRALDGLTGDALLEARERISTNLPNIIKAIKFRPDGSFQIEYSDRMYRLRDMVLERFRADLAVKRDAPRRA
jgi:DNA invertase Pin-like site-specific DNA recombinase